MENITSFYQDWNFWTVVLSSIAIIFSQLPPVHLWLKKAKIDFELHSRLAITHKVGNPNLQLYFLLSNVGGRKVKIKEIIAKIKRVNSKEFTLLSQGYLQKSNDQSAILFAPFSIEKGGEWKHIVNLFNHFSKEDEDKYLTLENNLRTNWRDKFKLQKEESKKVNKEKECEELIELDDKYVAPLKDFFNKNFVWESGEYQLTIDILTNQSCTNISKSFRFTIFESHTDRLKSILDRYKYGEAILYNPTENLPEVLVDVVEL